MAKRTEFVRCRDNTNYLKWKASRLLLQKIIRKWKRERVETLGDQIEGILSLNGEGKLKELYTELRVLHNLKRTLCVLFQPQ